MTIRISRPSPCEILIAGDRTEGDDHDAVNAVFAELLRRIDTGCAWTAACPCSECEPDGGEPPALLPELTDREFRIWQEAYIKGRNAAAGEHAAEPALDRIAHPLAQLAGEFIDSAAGRPALDRIATALETLAGEVAQLNRRR